MGVISSLSTTLNVSQGVVRLVSAFIGVAGLCFALLWIVDKIGDGRENKLRLDAAEAVLANIGMADAVDHRLEERDDAAEDKLEEVIDDAVEQDPSAANAPAGRVTNAVADELRRSRTSGEREPSTD